MENNNGKKKNAYVPYRKIADSGGPLAKVWAMLFLLTALLVVTFVLSVVNMVRVLDKDAAPPNVIVPVSPSPPPSNESNSTSPSIAYKTISIPWPLAGTIGGPPDYNPILVSGYDVQFACVGISCSLTFIGTLPLYVNTGSIISTDYHGNTTRIPLDYMPWANETYFIASIESPVTYTVEGETDARWEMLSVYLRGDSGGTIEMHGPGYFNDASTMYIPVGYYYLQGLTYSWNVPQ